jgi:uncharacterized protein (TIGR02099 family)
MSLTPPATTHPDLTTAPARLTGSATRWAPLRWAARLLLGLVITAWSLLLIAWLTLHWGILPHIEQWRGPLEARASAALGVPVRIGSIEVRSSGWVPSFELHEVLLLGADQRPALRLPSVFAAISPRSLLSLELRFEQLLIDGAQLEMRRDAQGRVFVAGLEVGSTERGNGSAAADWFFAQHEFVIRGGSLRWTDEQRNAGPIALTDVQLVVRNTLRHHDVRVDATPPPAWGERFTLTGRFTQPLLARRGDWQRWTGNAYADLPRGDVRELRRHVALPFELSEGNGALRGWFEVKDGRPVGATVDLALRAVKARLAPNVEPLDIEELEGRLIGQRNADGVSLAAERFGFLTGAGMRWPQGDMKLAWRQREGQAATGGAFSAQRLDVARMAQVASSIPLGDPLRKWLAELNPKGNVSDLSASWEGPFDAPLRYRAKAQISALALAARASAEAGGVGRPGLRGASLQLEASETGGQARIAINGGAIELPGVFDDPLLVLDQLSAQLLWKIEPAKVMATGAGAAAAPQLSVQVKDARFANADAKGELNAAWSSGAGIGTARGARYPGRLELDAKLSDGVASRTHRYLPLGIGKGTRHYLEHAVQGGKLTTASFRIRGDLWDFPFFSTRAGVAASRAAGKPAAADGEFRITAKVDDATYAFVPSLPATDAAPASVSPWPALTKANVDIVLDRGSFELRNGRAQTGAIEWSNVQGLIRRLDADATLTLDAVARGPLAEMLQVVNTTPVGGWTGKVLESASATGSAELKLGLNLPLAHIDTASAKGSVALAGNDVRISPATPLLGGATGRVDFSNTGFAVVGATAKVYGGDASFEGGTQADGSVRFNAQGTVSAEGLKRATELGAFTRAAAALTGQAAYRGSLGFVRGEPEFNLTSNLVGLALNLPAPLGKAAETPLALHVSSSVEPAVAGQAPRDTLRFELGNLGNLVQAQYLRELSGDAPRVLRGGIGVMEPAPQPAMGVAASINLKTLVVDEWEAAADKLLGTGAADSGNKSEGGKGDGSKSDYVPETIALHVQELTAGARRLTRVAAGLSQDAGVWRANLDADQLGGYIEYRPPTRRGSANAAAGRVYARLARLSLPKSDVEQVESLLDQQPATLPALDVIVEDFELRGKKLGRVEIEAINRSTGAGRDAVRDWQLAKFNITTPEAQLTATGHWSIAAGAAARGTPAARRAVMDFKLQLADSGALLDRLGTSKAIRGGKGAMSGQIAWLGSPFALDYPSLSGQINVAIEAGQFLKAEPGAARLLGVLSLQSLPRRLSLDFRDLFQEGFAFDNITGDVSVAHGVAQTNNLRMRGVQALVLMEGNADIERESQDLRVIVVPEINAGTAALAYAVINPAIGLGAFLAQALLKKPLTQAGTREFHVSGPWADPKVDRVDRKWSDDVPSFDAPASAPAKN